MNVDKISHSMEKECVVIQQCQLLMDSTKDQNHTLLEHLKVHDLRIAPIVIIVNVDGIICISLKISWNGGETQMDFLIYLILEC